MEKGVKNSDFNRVRAVENSGFLIEVLPRVLTVFNSFASFDSKDDCILRKGSWAKGSKSLFFMIFLEIPEMTDLLTERGNPDREKPEKISHFRGFSEKQRIYYFFSFLTKMSDSAL